ncbi:MAG: SdiA-regulated domain-containing protein [Hyphomonadaceae bacterium]
MSRVSSKTIVTILFVAALAACGDAGSPVRRQVEGSLFAVTPDQQWGLPDEMREISGMALSADGRLFAHDDERAVIYEIDFNGGRYVKTFSLGDPTLTDDFEGMAIAPDGAFWLTDSQGDLYRFREGENGAHVQYERFDTGLDDVCEVEGLAYLAAEESLILACKQNEARNMRDSVALYRWPYSGEAELWRRLPEPDLARAAGVGRFRPSSIEFDSRTGRIILLSANDAAMVELSGDGAVLSGRDLERAHPQPEGAAILPDGSLVISDEGGDGQALLSRYPRTP